MERRERGRAMVDWLVYNRYADNRGDLAMRMGYNPTVLSAALTGRNPFSDKLAKALCHYNKRLNYNWLIHEEGEMLLPEDASAAPAAQQRSVQHSDAWHEQAGADNTMQIERKKLVPLYKELNVSAGQADIFSNSAISDYIYIPGVDADAYFPIIGTSMQPNIKSGDTIGVKNVGYLERIDPERIYMVITRQNERMIKHIMPSKTEDDEITLTSDNNDFPPFQVRKEDILKVLKVVYVGRAL